MHEIVNILEAFHLDVHRIYYAYVSFYLLCWQIFKSFNKIKIGQFR